MSLNFIIAWKNDKWYINRVLIWRFTLILIKINYGQIGDQKGSFTRQTQYFIQDSRSSGNQCFFRPVCLGISGQLLLTHKPVGLLTCDILEVHGRFYWPGPSGLWLKAIGNGGKKRGHCHNNGFGNLLCIFYPWYIKSSLRQSKV
jgi:hypothetical protein